MKGDRKLGSETGLEEPQHKYDLGANYLSDGRCFFRVWAPERSKVELHLHSPADRILPMEKDPKGYWTLVASDVQPGSLYTYRLDEEVERADPASRLQPQGVHGPSEVVDTSFEWSDRRWHGIPLPKHVLYELHVGTFTRDGTFEAIIPHLDHLRDLGITTLELMPVAQFPGKRNWGYDGVYPFAVQHSYGGPAGLKRLVDAAHTRGLGVILDVVYNHLGPEGNYLGDFAPYFTDCYKTPWGRAINYDGPHSDQVRDYIIRNAVYWLEEYHLDGLRLDATHFMFDTAANPFLQVLAEAVRSRAEQLNRHVHLFAETDANDPRWILSPELGGYGIDCQWNDDFQHAVFTLLPGACAETYRPEYGRFDQLVKSYEEAYVYTGEYCEFRKRRHGRSARGIAGKRFVAFMQNHDQVGNRPKGDRICTQVDMETCRLAAAAFILSPYLPLIFMGEEYGERAPFLYFVDHGDPQLIEAVREGRKEEFASFMKGFEPPDPQDPSTMQQCVLDHDLRNQGEHQALWLWHRELLRLRREVPALAEFDRQYLRVLGFEDQRAILLVRKAQVPHPTALVFLCFHDLPQEIPVHRPGRWIKILDSTDKTWGGPGATLPSELILESSAKMLLPPKSAVTYVES